MDTNTIIVLVSMLKFMCSCEKLKCQIVGKREKKR